MTMSLACGIGPAGLAVIVAVRAPRALAASTMASVVRVTPDPDAAIRRSEFLIAGVLVSPTTNAFIPR